jgi:isoleucyl-tRNA synthetase
MVSTSIARSTTPDGFTPEVEHFAGQRVFEANAQIVEFMKERGVLLFSENYDHRYPHCWRCKNPVIFRATPQWFISMDQAHKNLVEKDEDGRDLSNFTDNYPETPARSLRDASLSEIEQVNWIPAWGVDRMRNMLKGRPDWCVSRQRVWGVSIPVFYCAKCTEAVADPAVINHVADIFEKESGDAWYTREAVDLLPAVTRVRVVALPSGPRKLTFSMFGSTAVSHQLRYWKTVKNFSGPPTSTLKVGISFAVGSTRL